MLSKFCLILVIFCSLVLDVEGVTTRGQQLGPDPNMPPEELLSFNLNNNNNNQYLNEFGKPRSHTKVDVLGGVLKKRVSQLRQHPRQEVDLVFLVDSSASVGSDNFYNEIKFIRKLLADFTVSINTTRVVIITYSSVDRVIRQVDHMTQPNPNLHKCLLLEEEIPSITYNSGGTYTLGALMQAIDVFQHGRPKAAKAVFLITDGYSNGGDPVPAADLLKDLGVTVFTFGIRNGNVKELRDMASLPTDEHSFILDSFQEFEALARRALHEDLSEGVFLPQDSSSCSRLCYKTSDFSKAFQTDVGVAAATGAAAAVCCDAKAVCSCGTHTGHFACICPLGHYGRGLAGDCTPCPAGTYKPTIDPGDKRTCLVCPLEHQTSDPGSHSLESCRCKNGYQLRNGRCHLMDCPVLEAPSNGYFIRNSCQNLFNSACGIQCNSGYQLEGGTGIRLCLPNGQWSGTQPRCVLRRCPSLQPPRNGDMSCSPSIPAASASSSESSNGVLMVVDTECKFSCRDGYRLVGSVSRTCLPIALWTGLPAYCKPIKCPRLRRPNYGEIYPSVCGDRRMHFGERCAFACRAGFELQGPTLRECLTPGVWTGGPLTTRCVDTTPPTIICPDDITVPTQPNLHYAILNISLPKAEDNSGYSPSVVSIPALTSATKFKIGTTQIKVGATDLSGNTRKCSFTVTVTDIEPPVVDFCQSPPIFLVDSKEDLEKGFITDIEWSEPIFHDNSLDDLSLDVDITTNGIFADGRFAIGQTTEVKYKATDSSGNNSTCSMEISVQEHHCLLPSDPINGHRNCSESDKAVYCTLTCLEGFAFAFQNLEDYFCPIHYNPVQVKNRSSLAGYHVEDPGKWLPESNPLPFPDCSVVSHSSMIVTPTTLTLEFSDNYGDGGNNGNEIEERSKCDDPIFLKQVANEVKAKVQKKMSTVCGNALYCDVTDLEAICQDVLDDEMLKTNDILGRKKRSSKSFAFDVALKDERRTSHETSASSNEGDDFSEITLHRLGKRSARLATSIFGQKSSVETPAKSKSHKIQVHFKMIGESKDAGKVDESGTKEVEAEDGDEDAEAVEESLKQAQYELLELVKQQGAGGRGLQIDATDLESSSKIALVSRGIDFQPIQHVCSPGSVPTTPESKTNQTSLSCVICPPGTFYESRSDPPICQHCPQGTFQPHSGQMTCYVCPRGTFTKDPNGGAKSIRQCKAQCRPGTYSSDGLERCVTCPKGSFSSASGSLSCSTCPAGTLTTRRGATSLKDCQKICPVGQVSEDGLSPCTPCPGGTFQDQPGQSACLQCPQSDASSTQFHRIGLSSVFECNRVHRSNWNLQNNRNLERIPINECFKYPCFNGGTCYPEEFGFNCDCPPGFTGSLCEVELDFCLSSPCSNGGQCIPGMSDSGNGKPYFCKCPEGFHGEECEFDEDECLSSPCLNDGVCVNEVASFLCICKDGFQGLMCEQQVNDCIENACQNGGTCIDGNKNYTCSCKQGFKGFFCERDIDECLSNPCQNGGTCIDGENEFHCICPTGYEGDLCQIDTDECALFRQTSGNKDQADFFSSDACMNGGTCRDEVGFFECNCRPGFTGKWCEQKLPSDYVLEFGNTDASFSGTTEYVLLTNREIPNMKEVTFCFWMTTTDKSNYGTPLSYATNVQDNEITFTDYSGFVFAIKGNKVVTDVTANDGTWTFLCAVWSSGEGYWAVFQDAILADEGKGLSKGETILGNGVFLLGQEQDALGSKFSALESFRGRLTRLNIWNRVLTRSEISETMTSCNEVTGNVASWADFHNGIHGLIQVSQLTPCHGCPPLEAPVHGLVTISTLETGNNATYGSKRKTVAVNRDTFANHQVAMYSCEEGYAIHGHETVRACGVLGDWRGSPPTCRLVNCGFPGYLANGYVIGQSYLYGDIVSYDCRQGFKLVGGDRTQRCTRDGSWSGHKPQCKEITCRLEEPFLNGYVVNSSSEYRIGERIVLRCNGTDLQMDGPSELTCLDDGTWSDILPTCQGPPCPKIPRIDHGDVLMVEEDHLSGVGDDESSYPTNTVVTYVCKEGFKFLAKGVDRIFCLPNGVWSGHRIHQTTKNLPKCVEIECDIPANFNHGLITAQSSSKAFNSSAKLTCDDGYQIFTPTSYSSQTSNSAWLKCSSRESWVMITAGNKGGIDLSAVKCRPMRCPFPEDTHRGMVEFSGLSIGSMARYSCNRPYRLVGRAQRRCLSTGLWSHKTPKCI